MVIRKKAVENEIYIHKILQLLEKLHLPYQNVSFYILAFIHRSIVNEKPDFAPEHNERLEFLGDAVLELVITERLFIDFPKKTEWELTDIRSALVRWRNLANITKTLNLAENLILWKWEELSWGRENEYLLANLLEAIIWAIYLDIGMEEVTKFIHTHIYSTIDDIFENNLTKDYKTMIQEFAQAQFDITPYYRMIEESGPDHSKNFIVWVYLKEAKIWEWQGSSKKKAQEEAAQNGYNNICKT